MWSCGRNLPVKIQYFGPSYTVQSTANPRVLVFQLPIYQLTHLPNPCPLLSSGQALQASSRKISPLTNLPIYPIPAPCSPQGRHYKYPAGKFPHLPNYPFTQSLPPALLRAGITSIQPQIYPFTNLPIYPIPAPLLSSGQAFQASSRKFAHLPTYPFTHSLPP